MYKTALRNQMRIHRTGSHSTMPAATGRVDLMPQWAQEPEEYYNTLREQFARLVEYSAILQEKIKPYTVALKRPLHPDDFERTRLVHDEYGRLIHILQEQMTALRPLVRAADQTSRAALSFHVAKNYLDDALLEKINNHVTQLIADWRPLPVLQKGRADLSPEKREATAKKSQKQRQRRISRDRREFWVSHQMSLAGKRAMLADERARDKEHHRRISEVVHDRRVSLDVVRQIECEQEIMAEKLRRLQEHFS